MRNHGEHYTVPWMVRRKVPKTIRRGNIIIANYNNQLPNAPLPSEEARVCIHPSATDTFQRLIDEEWPVYLKPPHYCSSNEAHLAFYDAGFDFRETKFSERGPIHVGPMEVVYDRGIGGLWLNRHDIAKVHPILARATARTRLEKGVAYDD